MLDDYRNMTRDIAVSRGAEYVDVRQAFQNEIPEDWIFYKGIVTCDGEHENEYGTEIVASLFATSLQKWLGAVTEKSYNKI